MPDVCPKERTQQSIYSPSTVANDEPILKVILDPTHYENGRIKKAAFPKNQLDAETLSVCRASYSSPEEINDQVVAPMMARNPRKSFVGVLRAVCREIRALVIEPEAVRVICVIDDGLEHYRAHAHLGFSGTTRVEGFWAVPNRKEAVRANLARAFGDILSLRDIFK